MVVVTRRVGACRGLVAVVSRLTHVIAMVAIVSKVFLGILTLGTAFGVTVLVAGRKTGELRRVRLGGLLTGDDKAINMALAREAEQRRHDNSTH